jgi:hypothetical protein
MGLRRSASLKSADRSDFVFFNVEELSKDLPLEGRLISSNWLSEKSAPCNETKQGGQVVLADRESAADESLVGEEPRSRCRFCSLLLEREDQRPFPGIFKSGSRVSGLSRHSTRELFIESDVGVPPDVTSTDRPVVDPVAAGSIARHDAGRENVHQTCNAA